MIGFGSTKIGFYKKQDEVKNKRPGRRRTMTGFGGMKTGGRSEKGARKLTQSRGLPASSVGREEMEGSGTGLPCQIISMLGRSSREPLERPLDARLLLPGRPCGKRNDKRDELPAAAGA